MGEKKSGKQLTRTRKGCDERARRRREKKKAHNNSLTLFHLLQNNLHISLSLSLSLSFITLYLSLSLSEHFHESRPAGRKKQAEDREGNSVNISFVTIVIRSHYGG